MNRVRQNDNECTNTYLSEKHYKLSNNKRDNIYQEKNIGLEANGVRKPVN